MATRSKSKNKPKSSQAKKIAVLEQRIVRLRKQLAKAKKSHSPRKSIRARLARALRARPVHSRTERSARFKRIKRIKRTPVVRGGTRKAGKPRGIKFHRKRRGIKFHRKRRGKAKRPKLLFRRRIIQGPGGEMVRLIAPISFRDWQEKLKRLRSSREYKKLRGDFPKLTYTIFGNEGGAHRELNAMIAYFERLYDARFNLPKTKRDDFFAHVVIYGVRRNWIAPNRKAGKHKKVNRTGRNR